MRGIKSYAKDVLKYLLAISPRFLVGIVYPSLVNSTKNLSTIEMKKIDSKKSMTVNRDSPGFGL
jgi:hypothetical protein